MKKLFGRQILRLIRIIKGGIEKDGVKVMLVSLQLKDLFVEVSNQIFLSFCVFLNFQLELFLYLDVMLYFQLKESNLAGHVLYMRLFEFYLTICFVEVLMVNFLLSVEHIVDHFEFIYPLRMKTAFFLLISFFDPVQSFSGF